MSTVEIDVWRSDWGLASIDLDCLEVLTYLKFLGIPLNIKDGNPFFTPKGKLPIVRDGTKTLNTLDEVIVHFKLLGQYVDEWLSEGERAECMAWSTLAHAQLWPALQVWAWAEERNYPVSRGAYARQLPLPLSWVYPSRYGRCAQALLEALAPLAPTDVEPSCAAQILYDEAAQALHALNDRLTDRPYLLGSRPCSADASVFACVALAVSAPLAAGSLGGAARALPALGRYVQRLHGLYHRARAPPKPLGPPRNHDDAWSLAHKFAAALTAAVAMLTYAVANGLFQFRVSNSDEMSAILAADDEE